MLRSLLFISVMLKTFAGQAQQYKDEIRKSIFFGGGRYYIEEEQIEELYYWLDSVPNELDKYDIHLISHTDPIGGKEYNELLSKMRSKEVQQICLRRPIPERKISVKD